MKIEDQGAMQWTNIFHFNIAGSSDWVHNMLDEGKRTHFAWSKMYLYLCDYLVERADSFVDNLFCPQMALRSYINWLTMVFYPSTNNTYKQAGLSRATLEISLEFSNKNS